MSRFDFTPLYRSSVGYDHLTNVMNRAFNSAEPGNGFPPYNIELVDENHYRITLAVAGFGQEDLSIEVRNQTLTVSGRQESRKEANFLHRGIGSATFAQRFQLADHVEVVSADIENGLLTIDLERRIPEALKPRTIEIKTGSGKKIKSTATGSKAKAA